LNEHPLIAAILHTWPDAKVTIMTPAESKHQALEFASESGGEYLERVGETDLCRLTKQQWLTFIATIVDAFERKRSATWGNEPPF
jgi:Family of unknown function (DUF6511)